MRKKDFYKVMAEKHSDIRRERVAVLCDRIFDALEDTLKKDGRVEIRGFGVFYCSHRSSRLLHDPSTGDLLEIPARRIPRFKAGKALARKIAAGGG